MSLAEAIRIRFLNLMRVKQIPQNYFCKKGGIPKSTVSQVLNGTRERVAIKTVYEMTATMGVSLSEFFDDPIFDEVTD